jgi:glycosyltransferase involved in cell wall biosynthesis
MRILMVGGTPLYPGGVEAFCERSRQAMVRQCDWEIWHMPADTSFLKLAQVPALLKRLSSLISYRRKGVDCLWLQYVCFPDLAYLFVAKLCGFTVMVTPHLGSNWRSQANPILRVCSGWLLALADRLALISRTQELEINLPKRVPRSAIRTFLPENVLTGDIPDSVGQPPTIQLIHSGRLSDGKGTFLFLDVCRDLQAAGVPFRAKITGGADEATYARIRAMIAAYSLQDRVTLLGRVSDEELLRLLSASDILVHLSKIDSYPLIVLESIACSMFPICIDLAGASDMLTTYTGHVVTGREAVAQTVEFVSRQQVREIRAVSKEAALRVRKDYAWARCVCAVQAAILETVQKPEAATA